MICTFCKKTKNHKDFLVNSRIKDNRTHDECRDCRLTPHAEKVSMAEVVKASSISRTSGTYIPAPRNIRKGADAFMRIKSRWV